MWNGIDCEMACRAGEECERGVVRHEASNSRPNDCVCAQDHVRLASLAAASCQLSCPTLPTDLQTQCRHAFVQSKPPLSKSRELLRVVGVKKCYHCGAGG